MAVSRAESIARQGKASSVEPIPHVIEFFGLPGSGKSTMVESIAGDPSIFAGDIVDTAPVVYAGRTRGGRLRFQLGAHYRLRKLAFAGYRLAFSRGRAKRTAARLVPALLVDTIRLTHASDQMVDGGVSIFDQGPLQPLRALLARTPAAGDRTVDRVLTEMHLAVQREARWSVISLETSAESASSRIEARPQILGRYDRMDSNARTAALQAESASHQRIVATMERLGFLTTLRLDGDLPADLLMESAPSTIRAAFTVIDGSTPP